MNNGEPGSEAACLPDAKLNGPCDEEIGRVRAASLSLFCRPAGVNLMQPGPRCVSFIFFHEPLNPE